MSRKALEATSPLAASLLLQVYSCRHMHGVPHACAVWFVKVTPCSSGGARAELARHRHRVAARHTRHPLRQKP